MLLDLAGRVQRPQWGEPGGIAALADLIDAHRGAFEYDWRARFHLPLSVIGKTMSWGEAWRQVAELCLDPASHVAAAVSGFDYPIGREALLLMDAYDLTVHIAWAQGGRKGSKPKPYPRPWRAEGSRRAKPSAELSQDEVIAALRRAGHTVPVPTR